jgi:hypothetical protein
MPLIDDLVDPMPILEGKQPRELTDAEKLKSTKVTIHEKRIGIYVQREMDLLTNMQAVYSLVWGQCSDALQAKIKGEEDYKTKSKEYNTIWLLETLKRVTAGIDDEVNPTYNYHGTLRALMTMTQGASETNDEWQQRVEHAASNLQMAKGKHVLASPEISKSSPMTDEDREAEEQKFLAMVLIQQSDQARYHDLIKRLGYDMNVGKDSYPVYLSSAYNLLLKEQKYQTNKHKKRYNNGSGGSGKFLGRADVSFAGVSESNETIVPGTDGKVFDVKCFGCQSRGHYRDKCPTATTEGNTTPSLAQIVTSFAQQQGVNKDIIDRYWAILDTCSGASVFRNRSLVKDVKACAPSEVLTVLTNGGSKTFTKKGTCVFLPVTVHLNESSMANILAFRDIVNIPGARVTLDTDVDRTIKVKVPNFETMIFKECAEGIYYIDTRSLSPVTPNNTEVTNYSFLSTVKDNQSNFTRQEVEGADRARLLQQQLGWPSTTELKRYVSENLISNCNVTIDDITRAHFIYGTPLPLLKGKMVRKNPTKANFSKVPIPAPILQFHKNVQLYMDFFFVNTIPFLHTKSKNINFSSIQPCKSRSKSQIIEGITQVLEAYRNRGFNVTVCHGDNEFDMDELKKAIYPTELQICGANEHLGIIERSVRTIKERARCSCHAVPFKRHTKLMTKSLVKEVVSLLNAFPSKDGISSTLSPAAIVEGREKEDFNKPRISHGSYAMVHKGTTNTMKRRSVPALALQHSNNRGGHYFMSLYTGKRLHSYNWIELPIDDEVIDRVHELAQNEGQKILTDDYPMFDGLLEYQ